MARTVRLPTRWVVPMHYRTPRVDFLAESEEEFDTAELPADGGPIAVVPAAP